MPIVAGHYVQNIGDEKLIFAELFKNPRFTDISLNKWLSVTPVQTVADHLNVDSDFVKSIPDNGKPEPVIRYKK